MINKNIFYSTFALLLIFALVFFTSCERDIDVLEPAEHPDVPEVFIDGFSAGLNYAAFGGSKVTAFDVDTDVKYSGTTSMKFAVPDFEDPAGAYAGGAYFTEVGRDLTNYDALTFWAKATKAATIDVIGFGNDLAEQKYTTSILGLKVNTNWKKYVIPIPDPSLLIAERGMMFYSEGPEDGQGYTFWIDEVKWEKLGTIAHQRPAILEEQDQTIEAEIGDELPIGGTFTVFNLPSGIDQRFEIAPAHFTYKSSDSTIATINEFGVVAVRDSGTAIITASIAGIAAKGSMTVEAVGARPKPTVPAPTPTVAADSVISLFSNAYTNVPVDTWNPFWEFSTTLNEDLQIDGNDVKLYTKLNFVGIEFLSQTIDASEMSHFSIDIWTPDRTDLPAAFKILLVDVGPDGVIGGQDNSSHEVSITSPILKTEEWVTISIPLSQFTGLASRAQLGQLVLSGDPNTVYIDNVYFYNDGTGGGNGGGGSAPTVAAPTPTQDASNVISIFSDVYTNLEGTNLNPDWGQGTATSEVSIAGNNTLQMIGLDYQGIELAGSQDISSMENLHIDIWTSNSTALNVYLISDGPVETPYVVSVPTTGWSSLDIPLSSFSPVDLADLIQFKFDGNGNIFIDNIYFYKGGGGGNPTEPTQPAPTPTQNSADVFSIFSDAYTNVDGTNLNPDWGQSTATSEISISGNNTLQMLGLNYQGIEFAGPQDVSAMGSIHLDVYTANSTEFKVFLISNGPVETPYTISVPTNGWSSVDIPLSAFSPVDMSGVIQMKFEGNGDIYIDNIYFYKEGGGGNPTEPTQPAPTPTRNSADVFSIFSDAYTNLDGTNLNPGWGQSTVTSEISISGNNTLQMLGLNYQGIELVGPQDVSAMESLHLDVYTANSTELKVFLISNGPVETPYTISVPTNGWYGVDVSLSSFSPVDLADVIQFKFEGNGDVYIDNIYFYKGGGGGGNPTEPTTAAPVPTFDAANVISIFSDSYTNVDGSNFNPGWGQSTVTSEVSITGNNTLRMLGLNYQGIELGSNQDVSGMVNLHIDIWTANSTELNVFIISPGPVETPYSVTVPTNGWASLDIPLSSFSPVDLADVFQFKFEGNGDIWIDNIMFTK